MALEDRSDRLQHEGARTLWSQVADDIAADIESGRLGSGVKLPNELELADQYQVARVTIRRAIKDLAERGLVDVVQGRGMFVAEKGEPPA